jgi:hypothetical protein
MATFAVGTRVTLATRVGLPGEWRDLFVTGCVVAVHHHPWAPHDPEVLLDVPTHLGHLSHPDPVGRVFVSPDNPNLKAVSP